MPDEAQTLTVTLPLTDWSVLLSALYEAPVPMKVSAPVANRLQQAMADAQKPATVAPLKRTGSC